MKPVNLNQLLFHPKTATLTFFQPPLGEDLQCTAAENFMADMLAQLVLQNKVALAKLLDKNKNNIKKILKSHPQKTHGFFLSEELQGYMILEQTVEGYCMMGNSFHVRPILEELFVNPEYMVVNVSLYDVSLYRGDFHHVEIVQHYEFEQLVKGIPSEMRSRVFTPNYVGLVPYKTMLALKTIAHKVSEMVLYQSLPIIVTGLDEMKEVFLRHFDHSFGLISHVHADFYEKTCSEILEKCKHFRPLVLDHYSAQFKERLKRIMKSKRLISDLDQIVLAASEGKIVHLILPAEKKLWGQIDLKTGQYELHKKVQKRNQSVDILNELAEEVMKQGGRIQIIGPHFFPLDSHLMAILRS